MMVLCDSRSTARTAPCVLLTALVTLWGCGGDDRPAPDAGAGTDGGGDGGLPIIDGGDGGGEDAGPLSDAGEDAGGATDSGVDSGGVADAGSDASVPGDAGPAADAGGDAGAASCTDGARDGDETDVDCGGATCGPCTAGSTCMHNTDCASAVCILRLCRAASCSDAIQNGDESDVDCGGATCPGCADGEMCLGAPDCASDICTGGVCQPPGCTDMILNAGETDVDCGGPMCMPCALGQMCAAGTDCTAGVCMGGTCQAPTCMDGIANGDETDVDCGGPGSCLRCADFRRCTAASDCMSPTCTMGFCGSNPCVPFGSDSFGYTGCSFTPATLPCPDISAAGTSLALGDDGEMAVPIGFSFDYYGTAQTMVTVGSNGGLLFDGTSLAFSNACLPLSAAPLQVIAAFWDDLDTSPGGSFVRYATVGTAPNRSFVVNWNNERLLGTSGDTVDVTAVLSEGTNHIEVCYADTRVGSAAYDSGASATAGISGSATQSVQLSCNTPSLTDGLLVRYLHP